MYIAMVSAECAPVAKAGGLGDFIHGLSRELALRGHRVEVLLPKYDSLRYDLIEDLRPVHQDLQVPYFDEIVPCRVDQGLVDGVECLFIDPRSSHAFFERGHIYGEGDDDARFALFCRAVLEFPSQSGRRPDILHSHDWQTGLIPVLLWEVFEGSVQGPGMGGTRTLYTLHNLGHQGWVTEAVLRQVGLSPQRLDHTGPAPGLGQPPRRQPAEGRHRLLQLRHHRLPALCMGGAEHRAGHGAARAATPVRQQVRRGPQRHRHGGLEPALRPPPCPALWPRDPAAQGARQDGPAPAPRITGLRRSPSCAWSAGSTARRGWT